jgi:hypothetical protein
MKNPGSHVHSHHHAPPCMRIPFRCNGRPCCMFIFLYEPICIGSSCRSPLKRGTCCHDPPSKFSFPPASYAGPSIAPAAPAPLAQSHHVQYHAPDQPPAIPASSTTPFYDQMTYYTVEPLDHIMEDIELRPASPRDMDMQGSTMLKTPSPDSNGLPFHPKYRDTPGLETMSPEELTGWLRNHPHTPPMYCSQPTSAGHTRPVSPSSSDSASLRRRTLAEGHYTPVTRQATPEDISDVAPADGPPAASSRCSLRSPFGGLLPLTPLVTQILITGSEPVQSSYSRQSSGGYSYRSSPAVETADIPEGLLPIDDS